MGIKSYKTGISPRWSKIAKRWIGNFGGMHCHWCKNKGYKDGEVFCRHPKSKYNDGDRIRVLDGELCAKKCGYFSLDKWYKNDKNIKKGIEEKNLEIRAKNYDPPRSRYQGDPIAEAYDDGFRDALKKKKIIDNPYMLSHNGENITFEDRLYFSWACGFSDGHAKLKRFIKLKPPIMILRL